MSGSLHFLSSGSSVADRLRELVDLSICGSGVGGESDLIRSLAKFLLVGSGDPSGEELASGESLSPLLFMTG